MIERSYSSNIIRLYLRYYSIALLSFDCFYAFSYRLFSGQTINFYGESEVFILLTTNYMLMTGKVFFLAFYIALLRRYTEKCQKLQIFLLSILIEFLIRMPRNELD